MKKHDILKHLPLETDRLILRTFALEDAAMTKAAMDARAEDLCKWMSWSSEEGMSVNAINGFIQSGLHADNTLDIPLVAVDKGTGAFVLSTGIHAKDDDFRTISVGWWIAKDAEGKGLAYEAMSALLDFSFETVGANLIETQYYEGNHRSKSLIERLGFSHFNTVANGHTSHLDGGLMNVHEYKRLCGVSSSGISIRRWNEYDWEVFKAIRMEAVTGYSHVFLNNAETTMSYADDHWKGMLRDTYNDAIFGLYDGDTVIGLTGAFRWRDSPSDTVILGMSGICRICFIRRGSIGPGHRMVLRG
jgi:ribosomal-protein-serine acetyltransferase